MDKKNKINKMREKTLLAYRKLLNGLSSVQLDLFFEYDRLNNKLNMRVIR